MVLHTSKRPSIQPIETSPYKPRIPHRFVSTTPSPLTGARCIITGASRGIGRAIALAFAAQHASILLLGRNTSSLDETLSLCTSLSSKSTFACRSGDISQRSFWTSLDLSNDLPSSSSSSSSSDANGLDILVNAAGITHSSLFVRTSASLIEDVVQTNLMGTLWGCQIMGKKMLRNKPASSSSVSSFSATSNASCARVGKGVIVNIASLLATHGGSGSAAYAASKAGILGLTRSLAAELGPAGVRVNAVLPGYIETDMTRAMTPQAREEALAKIPCGRFGTVEEVADAAVFLATNAYANNCIVNLDGGLSAT